ncbi:glycosyl transferase [Coprinopsis sp. MPI-PUGE-AT-0042]|nr:glycosyl transferase [Coprinopsis sp. MPI-PUGE-AT-0042]
MSQQQETSPDSANGSAFRFTETQDWFSHNIPHWKDLFPLVTSPKPRILEIGSWEGRSAVFLAASLVGDGEIVCIDHFDLFKTQAGRDRFETINHNLSLTGKRHRVLPEFSFPALMKLLEEEMEVEDAGYDWVYVDGSHRADDTLLDGELAWRLARKGAVFIFDDYNWESEPKESMRHPKRGIDTFLELHKGEYERLTLPEHYQVVLQKTSDMRIGFLVPTSPTATPTSEAFAYGINVVTVTDSLYAMPASVSLSSLVRRTPGPITIYIIDCGLSSSDREMIRESVPDSSRATLKFIELRDDSLARRWGAAWAKVQLHEVLPVERVLYLDADTLVRGDITELWRTDLGEMVMGAAVDVGYPMGHDGVERGLYFNSGVLLIDLYKMRAKVDGLEGVCERFKEAKLADQDALNEHFRGCWKRLSLRWNAQGLGTYAKFYAPDRHLASLDDMEDPAIVHFTGSLHPPLAEVLNPFVQPYTAKPWGYAGGPGHPYAAEWFEALKKTRWEDFYRSEWKQTCAKAREIAKSAALASFDKSVASAQFDLS